MRAVAVRGYPLGVAWLGWPLRDAGGESVTWVLMTSRWILAAALGVGLAMLGAVAVDYGRGNVAVAQGLVNCETSSAALDAYENELIGRINHYRQQNGRSPLLSSPGLSREAAWQSEYLARTGAWSHNGPPTRSPDQRAKDCGYTGFGYFGENIAQNGGSLPNPALTLEQWKSSPGHNAALLNSNFTVIGVGFASTAGTYGIHYWTAGFGDFADPGTTGPVTWTPSSPSPSVPPPPPPATATPTVPTLPTQPPPPIVSPTPSAIPTSVPTVQPQPDYNFLPSGVVVPRLRVAMLASE